jgi:hypothetical protein
VCGRPVCPEAEGGGVRVCGPGACRKRVEVEKGPEVQPEQITSKGDNEEVRARVG